MNVKQLREALADMPDDLMVVVRGYEGGVDDVESIEPCIIELDVNDAWYYGKHEVVIGTDSGFDRPGQKAAAVALAAGPPESIPITDEMRAPRPA